MRFSKAFFALVLFLSSISQAIESSVDLPNRVSGTGVQPVEVIQDTKDYNIRVNDFLTYEEVNLDGWGTQNEVKPDRAKLLESFAVRTLPSNISAQQAGRFYYIGQGVGRSGVLEKSEIGDYFAKVGTVYLKGLTIKGYGGNTVAGKSQQPDGSLNASEAYRDTLTSKILLEYGVDTYVGSVTVERGGTGSSQQANFIRLSRTSLRMNDLYDRKGQDLRKTVDHLIELLQDEVGMKMTPEMFMNWLVARTARTLAGKEYLGLRHGSQTRDNLGIAELVDHGEGVYDPAAYSKSTSQGQVSTFRGYVMDSAKNIAKEYGLDTSNLDKIFEENFNVRTNQMAAQDASKIMLDTATIKDLQRLGLSANATRKVLQMQSEDSFGILSVNDILESDSITNRDRKLLMQKTATEAMKIDGGKYLPLAITNELTSAGIREVLSKTLSIIKDQNIDKNDTTKVQALLASEIENKLNAMKKPFAIDKANGGWGSFYGVNVVKHTSAILQKYISNLKHDPLNHRPNAMGLSCSKVMSLAI